MRDGFSLWWNDERNLNWILEGKGDNPFQVLKSNKTLKTGEIVKKKELESMMVLAISVNHAANMQSQVLSERILEILELLNKEIEKE